MTWNRTRTWALFVGLCLLAASVGGAISLVGGAESGEIYNINADHDLASESEINEYQDAGVVRTNLTTPNVGLTIAESAAACGVEQNVFSDLRSDFLCIDYREDVTATLQLYVPKGYWHPYIREAKSPVAEGPSATLNPVDNSNFTSVRATFSQPVTAVYAIPSDRTTSYRLLERANQRSKKLFGMTLWSEGSRWQTISDASLTEQNVTVEIQTTNPDRTLVQYNMADEPGERTWVTVPDSKDHRAPVYRMERRGNEDTVFVVTETNDPPALRHKVRGNGPMARVEAAMDEIRSVDDQIQEMVDDFRRDGLPFIGGGSA